MAFKVIKVFNERVINASKEDLHKELDLHFEKAKRASDFIAMIFRLSLAIFAMKFFWTQADNQPNFIYRYAYHFTSLAALALTLYLGSRISAIIATYWSMDAATVQRGWQRYLVWVLGTLLSLAIWLSVFRLAWDFARKTGIGT